MTSNPRSRPASLRRSLRFCAALLATTLRASLSLRRAFVMQVTFMMLNNLTFSIFWWVLMRRVHSVRGWELADIALGYGLVAAGYGLAFALFGGLRQLGRFIDEGELDTLLTQPKPVLLYAAGLRSQVSGFGDFLSGVGLIALSGRVSPSGIPLAVLAVATSALVFASSATLIFSLSFWAGPMDGMARMLLDLVVTFGVYPEPLFGGALKLLLFTLIPAGLASYLPVQALRAPSAAGIALMIAAAAVYAGIAIGVFRRGLARYASGSRFGTFG